MARVCSFAASRSTAADISAEWCWNSRWNWLMTSAVSCWSRWLKTRLMRTRTVHATATTAAATVSDTSRRSFWRRLMARPLAMHWQDQEHPPRQGADRARAPTLHERATERAAGSASCAPEIHVLLYRVRP